MFEHLSDKQKEILKVNEGRFVVKACPGSGKTYSVAARIARLLQQDEADQAGIAALSFTNVACEEISQKLKDDFNYPHRLSYPNFIGTLDSFFNQYVFLPYGHLIMGCEKRPQLVGEPHAVWTKAKGSKKYRNAGGQQVCYDADPNYYFDCISFDLSGELIPIVAQREFHFSFKNYFKQNGDRYKVIQELYDSKWANFKLGYANQSDANYLSLQVLLKFPLIAKTLAKKFKYLIVDEAQDTNEIQMRLIEILNEQGAANVMLIGDRDQSIFEWNHADPALFDKKFKDWPGLELDENRRSSQLICNFSRPLSSFDRFFAVNPEVAAWDFKPRILGYDRLAAGVNTASFDRAMQTFIGCCEENGINICKENVAVIFRGKDGVQYLGISKAMDLHDQYPWEHQHYFVREIVRGKYLLEAGDFKAGYKLLERGLLEGVGNNGSPGYHLNQQTIHQAIEKLGFREYRDYLFALIKLLPATTGLTLNQWIDQTNALLKAANKNIALKVKKAKANLQISDIFGRQFHSAFQFPFTIGTIHSVKGKTFDAVLLMLGKKAGNKSNYTTMLTKGCKEGEHEELRNIYVGITRPRKVLVLVVPNEDVAAWDKYLNSPSNR